MIFCSRRVFLNVVTQLMDGPTLLNANYFIVDQKLPSNKNESSFIIVSGLWLVNL